MSQPSSIVLDDLHFSWPDGAVVFDGLTAAFGPVRTGLVGTNGSGKSTLLRLIAGELRPTRGSVSTAGAVGVLPQQLTLRTAATVAELLGIAAPMAALRAIERGESAPELFETVGDDWDVEERAAAELAALGLPSIGLDRQVGQLSGGEAVLVALAGLRLARAPIVLLDEPTNNLDRDARARLGDALEHWPGTLLVVSHDVALLERMDATAELHSGELRLFGGPYRVYREQLEVEQAAAAQALRTAEAHLKAERRERQDAETKLAHRNRTAKKAAAESRVPKIVAGLRKSAAEVSAGKARGIAAERLDAAKAEVEAREADVRDDRHIRIELPDPHVPAGRTLVTLDGGHGTEYEVRGPQRVALLGRNGIGKTRMLSGLPHEQRIGVLPQRLDHLDDDASIVDAVAAAAPDAPPERVRAGLARFLFRGRSAERAVGELSGGERFRVALAQLLLAEPAHQLLVLDEPTNNLDLVSIDQLVEALSAYRGALIVVSHDDAFLARLSIDTWLELTEAGLHPVDDPTR